MGLYVINQQELEDFKAPSVYPGVRKLTEFLSPAVVYNCSCHLLRDDFMCTNINNYNESSCLLKTYNVADSARGT